MFENNFNNGESQIFVERQLLATLIHIRDYGNAVFLSKIGDLYRIEKVTIDKICHCLITAI